DLFLEAVDERALQPVAGDRRVGDLGLVPPLSGLIRVRDVGERERAAVLLFLVPAGAKKPEAIPLDRSAERVLVGRKRLVDPRVLQRSVAGQLPMFERS